MSYLVKARGLVTYRNELGNVEGALAKADNVNIDEPDVITPRRGFNDYGDNFATNDTRLKQVMQYKDRIIRHFLDQIQYEDANGNFIDVDGSYQEVEDGIRVKYQEANGNLYFTTSNGIKKISARTGNDFNSQMVTSAGGVKAVDLETFVEPVVGGFLPSLSKCAYRVVFGTKDRNNNLILGAPSSRAIATNITTDVRTPERSQILLLDYTVIANGDYLIFDTPSNRYLFWFDTDGNGTAPITSDSVNRLIYKIDLQDATTNANAAVIIATNITSVVFDIDVDLVSDTITLTNQEPGSVADIKFKDNTGIDKVTGIEASTLIQGVVATGQSANVQLTITVPFNVTTDFFYQVYRSSPVRGNEFLPLDELDPGDELNLVFEAPVEEIDRTTGTIIVEDITSETFRNSGLPLYTNPISGQGIQQINSRPPLSKDIELFRNVTFYANTKTVHNLKIDMLGVTQFNSGTSKFIISNSLGSREYTFVGEQQIVRITPDTTTNTTAGSFIRLYAANNIRKYYLWFDTTGSDTQPDVVTYPELLYHIPIKVSLYLYDNTIEGSNKAIRDALLFFEDFDYLFDITSIEFNNPIDKLAKITVNNHQLKVGDTIFVKSTKPLINENVNVVEVVDSNTIIVDFEIDVENTSTDVNLTNLYNTKDIILFNTENGATDNIEIGTLSPGGAWVVGIDQAGEGEDVDNQQVLLSRSASIGISIDATARSLVKNINRDVDSPVIADYISGFDDLPGQILFEAKDIKDDPFFLSVSESIMTDKFNPELPLTISNVTSINFESVSNSPAVISSVGHGLFQGEEIFLRSPNTTPQIFQRTTVNVIDADTFSVPINITTEDTDGNGVLFFRPITVSDNLESPNRLYFSKLGQPEAVPPLNYIEVGPKDEPIERILSLRDNLFVFKTDGIYVVSGVNPPNFTVRLLDNTAIIIAPDSAEVLNNQIYALTTQGVTGVSDTGASVISRQIENLIKDVTRTNFPFRKLTFGVAYENERSYHLWLPTLSSDTVATQCYRFNIFERNWTRWTIPATCGAIKRIEDQMYIGDGTRNFLLKERKNGDRTDHADREFMLEFIADFYNGKKLSISSIENVTLGDVILQIQYVTINFFNRMLKKLDLDLGYPNDFFETLEQIPGTNITNAVQALNDKLVSEDASITPFVASNDWVVLRDQMNAMIEEINDGASKAQFKNYRLITDVIEYEAIVTGLDKTFVGIEVNYELPLLQGAVKVFKGIPTQVEWQPQHFGDPSLLKQIREATIMFDQNSFYRARISFASDLSQNFVEIPFLGRGIGYWGYGIWGTPDFYWGGNGNDAPFRTIVPIEKQRCRYLSLRFNHIDARAYYRIVGISAPVRVISNRGYR